MSVSEYYGCYLHEVISVIDAYYDLEEQRQAAEWQRTRMLAFYTVKPHDTKKKIKKPSDLFKLSSDKVAVKKSVLGLKERIKRDRERQKQMIAKWKQQGILN